MKGLSAIISIILLVMISVSLAGLAWLWFFQISNLLKNTATNATETVTTKLGMQFRLEAAKFYSPNYVNATIRNIGTVDINLATLGIFIDNSLHTTAAYIPNTGKIIPGETTTIKITNNTAACSSKILKITIESGTEDYKTIDCS